jgi:hypothetical protein
MKIETVIELETQLRHDFKLISRATSSSYKTEFLCRKRSDDKIKDPVIRVYCNKFGTVQILGEETHEPYATVDYYGELVTTVYINTASSHIDYGIIIDNEIEGWLMRNPTKLSDVITRYVDLNKKVIDSLSHSNKNQKFVIETLSDLLTKKGKSMYDSLKSLIG